MNRRQFLKTGVAALLATLIPHRVVQTFEPKVASPALNSIGKIAAQTSWRNQVRGGYLVPEAFSKQLLEIAYAKAELCVEAYLQTGEAAFDAAEQIRVFNMQFQELYHLYDGADEWRSNQSKVAVEA